MKAAVYLRVSTDRQDEANQEPECLRVCAARGWTPVLFRERESGTKARPVWQQALDSIHRGECGAVVLWSLDRAGRDRVRLCHDLAELSRKSAAVVSVREPWLDQPAGLMRDLLISILTWVAAFERSRLVERTRAGLARAVAGGKTLGRHPLPEVTILSLRAAWLAGEAPARAAERIGVPGSTARTYYTRFDTAKKGIDPASPKTAESQEV